MKHSTLFKAQRATAAASLAFSAIAPLTATADTTALAPAVNDGGQVFDDLFGMDFNVNATPIQVTQLGVFDNHGDGVLKTDSTAQPIVIQIFNRDTGVALATVNFGGGSPTGTDTSVGAGKVFFQALATPLLLPTGNYYLSEDYSGSEGFGNVSTGQTSPTVNDGGGLISFVGSGRASNAHGAMYNGGTTAPSPPATTNGFLDAGPANRYNGPDFQFTSAAVPEPSTWVAAGGLLLLAAGDFRRRLKA